MKKVTPEEGQSADIIAENIEYMKELFPEAFTEDGVNFETLRQLLGDAKVLDEGEEKYGLNWHGKKKARQIALTPSTGTLLPCPEESVDWDTTKNLFIEGDNLEVLKLLQKSYANKVKMIYIDPPYNTGKEFIYPDKFQENLDTYLRYTGQVNDEGMKFSSNTEATGRKHTNWLNMLYPRLKLAKTLLRKDGVIFISIDDNEQHNLKALSDEIFGAENFIAQLIWSNQEGGGSSDSSYFRIKHEYILCYAKNRDNLVINGVDISNRERYTQKDEYVEERGPYYLQKLGMGSIQYSESLDYKIQVPDGSYVTPKDNNKGKKACWRWSKSKYEWGIENGFIEIKKDSAGIWTIYTKQYLSCDNEGNKITRTQRPFGIIDRYSSTQASKYLDSIGMGPLFNYTKPHELISFLIERVAKNDDLVLDFFAGSSTAAQSVMSINANNGESIRFIMVQLPELIDKKLEAYKQGYRTIAEISKERIRRSARKIQEEHPEYNGDLGFKVFKLSNSNIQTWNPDRTDLEETLLSHEEHLIEGRSEQDVLYELLLKRGVDLAVPIESREVKPQNTRNTQNNSSVSSVSSVVNIYSVGYGVLFACLTESITREQVEDIAQAIIDWHAELAPSSETHVFFRDSAFRDDVSKTNMAAILEQNGITHVRSL